jgi:tetratricopeptide (TPR) repeat protein
VPAFGRNRAYSPLPKPPPSGGGFDYVAASVPWSVRWLALLLGLEFGNKARGKQRLEAAAEKAVLVGGDAAIMLVLIYTREKEYEKAYQLLTGLGKKYPENYLVQLDRAGLARRMRNFDLATSVLSELLVRIQSGEFASSSLPRCAVYHQFGLSLRAAGKLRAAEGWFRISLQDPDCPKSHRTMAHLELAKTLDLAGRHEDAVAHYEQVLKAEDVGGSRREARSLIHSGFRPEF